MCQNLKVVAIMLNLSTFDTYNVGPTSTLYTFRVTCHLSDAARAKPRDKSHLTYFEYKPGHLGHYFQLCNKLTSLGICTKETIALQGAQTHRILSRYLTIVQYKLTQKSPDQAKQSSNHLKKYWSSDQAITLQLLVL